MNAIEPGQVERDTEPSEPFKQFGCTILTVLFLLFLVVCVFYFFTGLAAMLVQFYRSTF